MSVLEANVTQLKGRTTVEIGGVDFDVEGGNVFGLAADKPSASDAHAAIPFCYYISADDQTIEQTDGTDWVAV